MNRPWIVPWIVLAVPQLAAAQDPPQRADVRHLPAPQVDAEAPELEIDVLHPHLVREVRVVYRTRGSRAAPRTAVFERDADGWVARLDPAALNGDRGIDYWIVMVDREGQERPVFASERSPHPAAVHESDAARHLREELELRGGRRSRAIVRAEYVGLGSRDPPGAPPETEQYFRIEASYAHAFYTRVEEIRLAIGRLRGNVVRLDEPGAPLGNERGLDYGTAEITWYALPLLRFRTSVLFGYSQEGFAWGGGGDVVVGRPDSTSFTFGATAVTTVGWTALIRLGWLTVPRVPMGATVEVGTFPADAETGMRLLFDAGYELYPGAVIRLQAGYRGWNSTTGGPSLGTEIALAF